MISMASKYYFPSLFFLVLVLFQTVCSQSYGYTYCSPCQSCCSDLYNEIKNTTVTVVEVDKITKALRDSGYKTMAMILEKNLRSTTPYCENFLFFVDRQNRFTIYGDNALTLFAPPDDMIRFEKWIDLEYQVAMSRVDEEAFESGSISEGSKFVTLSPTKQRLVVDQVFDDGTVSINSVKIKQWNIYNDGHVIVHGTEDFFNHFFGETPIMRHFWYDEPMDTDWMEIFEDPKTGSYTTKKMFAEEDEEYNVRLSKIQVLL